jgi:hypothetical protein
MRMSVGVGPFRFYSSGRPRKPAPPIESLPHGGMIALTVIMETIGIWFGVVLLTQPVAGSVSSGITILIVVQLILAWQWLKWASKHNPTSYAKQTIEDKPVNQASVSNRR